METIQLLFPMGLTIALVSFMESIAVAKAIQTKHRNYKVEPNQFVDFNFTPTYLGIPLRIEDQQISFKGNDINFENFVLEYR